MLKNMKVGTKLIAVVIAPVLVLVVLAGMGVTQRLDTATAAKRVEQLAEMAAVSANLSHELQNESVLSAASIASGGKQWADELHAQQALTDQAVAQYEASLAAANPSADSAELATSVAAVSDQLALLAGLRESIASGTIGATEMTTGFVAMSDDLTALSATIAQGADDPTLARGLATFAGMNRLKASQANEAALSVGIAQAGYFPDKWPTHEAAGAPCPNLFAGCEVYSAFATADADLKFQERVFVESSTEEQQRLYSDAHRDQTLGSFEDQIKDSAASQVIATLDPKSGLKLNSTNSVAVVTTGAETVYSPKISVNSSTGAFTKVDPAAVVQASTNQLTALQTAEMVVVSGVLTQAQHVRSDARQAALYFVVGTLGAIAIALIIAFYVARSVTGPLKRLTRAAHALWSVQLPALVEGLRNPDGIDDVDRDVITPISVRSNDEIGQLATEFNSIQDVTVEVAEEQSVLLRKGIGEIFINLARRNQTLLDRQIEFIDQLESHEEDPEQLENLFKLDHLATRMRRNAESLLVLAGAEPPRRRGRPIPLADVVRVAIGEVEDFARISIVSLDEVTVGGNVAVDLAHLLSELMENATHFSPPDSAIEIDGRRSDTGYVLSITDHGIGMSPEQFQEANQTLARPPLVGLALSRSLGFIVIGRLASRFSIGVEMNTSASGGVTALVTIPGNQVYVDGQLLVDASDFVSEAESSFEVAADVDARDNIDLVFDASPEQEDVGIPLEVADQFESPEPVDSEASASSVEPVEFVEPFALAEAVQLLEPTVLAEPDELPEVELVDDVDFQLEVESFVNDESAPRPVEGVHGRAPVEPPVAAAEAVVVSESAVPDSAVPEAPVAEIQVPDGLAPAVEEPALTAAGLVRRTPKKRSEDGSGTSAPGTATRGSGASQRSPEEVRKMLSRYRSGLDKGRSDAATSASDPRES
ncbi:MAG: nitrate- and nitrite sensing domain-containing protein [Actinomycetes bacterium]